MRLQLTKLVLLCALAGCGGASSSVAPAAPAPTTAPGPRIGVTTLYVDDQAKALTFYTEVVGFTKKDDVSNSGYRWLTVTSPAAPGGTELLLALDADPAAKAFKQAMFAQDNPAVMFYTDDVARDYERMTARGAEFTLAPTEVMAGSKIAIFKDCCGNLVQLTQLAGRAR